MAKNTDSVTSLVSAIVAKELELIDSVPPTMICQDSEFLNLLGKWYQSKIVTHGQRFTFSDAEIMEDFFKFIGGYFKSGRRTHLHPCQLLAIKLSLFYFSELKKQNVLHRDIFLLMRPIKVGLIRVFLHDPEAIFDRQGFFRSLIFLILNIAKGYDEYSGSRFNVIKSAIETTARKIGNLAVPTAKSYQDILDDLMVQMRDYNSELKAFEDKVKIKEKGLAHSKKVKLDVDRIAYKAMSGEKLPVFIISFIQDIWSKYLYITYLREGMDSETWLNGIDTMELLIWSVSTEESDKLRESYATKVFAMMRELRAGLDSMHHNIDNVDRFIDKIEQEQLDRISGEPIRDEESILLPPIEESEEEKQTLYPLARRLRVGEWVKLQIEEKTIRAKVIDKNFLDDYVLFSNYSGIKIASFTELHLQTLNEQNLVEVMSFDKFFDDVIDASCEYLNNQFAEIDQRKNDKDFLERLASERLEIEKRKAIQRKKVEQEKREAENAEHERELGRIQQVEHDVATLHAGALVEFTLDDGNKKTLKLGLVLNSTDKLIFLDNQDRRDSTLYKKELIQLVKAGRAKIVERGQKFEDSLASVVASRRQSLSNTRE